MSDALIEKLESGALNFTPEELEEMTPEWRAQVEADLAEEAEHQALIALD